MNSIQKESVIVLLDNVISNNSDMEETIKDLKELDITQVNDKLVLMEYLINSTKSIVDILKIMIK